MTEGASGVEISRKTNIAQSTISRWFQRKITRPDAEQVKRVITAYNLDPLAAYQAAGIIASNDTEREVPARLQLREFSSEDIAAELLRRAREHGDPGLGYRNGSDPE